jgi:hypothetical protein
VTVFFLAAEPVPPLPIIAHIQKMHESKEGSAKLKLRPCRMNSLYTESFSKIVIAEVEIISNKAKRWKKHGPKTQPRNRKMTFKILYSMIL